MDESLAGKFEVTRISGEWEHNCSCGFHRFLVAWCDCPDCVEFKELPLKKCPICGAESQLVS